LRRLGPSRRVPFSLVLIAIPLVVLGLLVSASPARPVQAQIASDDRGVGQSVSSAQPFTATTPASTATATVDGGTIPITPTPTETTSPTATVESGTPTETPTITETPSGGHGPDPPDENLDGDDPAWFHRDAN
jgi:hypothetical protein